MQRPPGRLQTLNLGARPASDEGLTYRMATLNIEKFSGETGKDGFGCLTAVTARLRFAQIPAKFWVKSYQALSLGSQMPGSPRGLPKL